jgi:uncharacterized protein DUF6491
MRKAFLTLPLLLIACTAATGESPRQSRNAARIAAAQPAGEPVDCVELNRIRSTHVLDERTIDFELSNGQTLRNTLPNRCPGLAFEESFTYSTSLSRLCSVDFITVLERAGGIRRGASCGLGKFQPVTFPAR